MGGGPKVRSAVCALLFPWIMTELLDLGLGLTLVLELGLVIITMALYGCSWR